MLIKNKRIIVTGGAGFIGSHVVDMLLSNENQVIIIDDFSTGKWQNIEHNMAKGNLQVEKADVRDLEKMIFLTKGADVVFHLAVACLRTSLNNPICVHEINATATLNMCRACLENNVERFIYTSSSEAYGSAVYVPMDEEHPLKPTTVYGASKAAGELYTLAYWRTYGLPAMVVRPFNTYGPREPSDGCRAEVIPKFVLRGMAGLQPVIFGTGHQTRDFTWVEDTARGIIMAAECDDLIGDTVNIARGQEVSIERICELVIATLGNYDLKPCYLEDGRPGDVVRHYADISKARRIINYSPTVDIEQGIERYVDWIRTQSLNMEQWIKQEKVQNW
jgi:UDP-glucose 4-epimerase